MSQIEKLSLRCLIQVLVTDLRNYLYHTLDEQFFYLEGFEEILKCEDSTNYLGDPSGSQMASSTQTPSILRLPILRRLKNHLLQVVELDNHLDTRDKRKANTG